MNATSQHSSQEFALSSRPRKALFAAVFLSIIALSAARAQLSYNITDMGTLGGSVSTPSVANGQQGMNQAGMFVGSSTVSDGSEHAFLYTQNQMYDLNLLCDLSTSDFKVLTVARTINDCGEIVGEGLATNGDKHAFLMTPALVNGGRWCYSCCKWTWKHDNGWWYDGDCHCYQWHGPPGPRPPCPPNPPPCWWWPLPSWDCPPPPPPPDWCWCCINGVVYFLPVGECELRHGQCYGSKEE